MDKREACRLIAGKELSQIQAEFTRARQYKVHRASSTIFGMLQLAFIQKLLIEQEVDGWLFYDFCGSDPMAYRILNLSADHGTASRRWFYFIPSEGEPTTLAHTLESSRFAELPGRSETYSSWEELRTQLARLLPPKGKVAMQYSPHSAIPSIAKVDAGMVELIRSFGPQIVGSAVLVQHCDSLWTDEQHQMHLAAANALTACVEDTFAHLAQMASAGKTTDEKTVQSQIMQNMLAHGLRFDSLPFVAVGANTADPFHRPLPSANSAIGRGDYVLIGAWGKLDHENAVYAGYTWSAVLDKVVPTVLSEAYEVVCRARDATLVFLQEALGDEREVNGWEVDAVCRREVQGLGYGQWFTHGTGHAVGRERFGTGVNPDDYELHDDRLLLPRSCFTIGPGLYRPGRFGVRNEINVYLDEDRRITVSGPVEQNAIRTLL